MTQPDGGDTMIDEAQIFLSRRADIDRVAFERAIRAVAKTLPGVTLAFMTTGSISALPQMAGEQAPRQWEAILTTSADAMLDRLAERLSDVIDPASSTIAVGSRHEILPGVAPIRVSITLRRLDRLTSTQFHDYWLNVHADFGRQVLPPYSYYQIHISPERSRQAAARTGLKAQAIDGIGEVHFPDVASMERHLVGSEKTALAQIDERNFIDHAHSRFAIYDLARSPANT